MILKKIIQYKGHRGAIYDLAIWNDRLLSVGGDGWVVSWALDASEPDGTLLAKVDAKIFSLCVLDHDLLVLGDMNGHLFWIDLKTRETLKNVKIHTKGIFDIQQHGDFVFTIGGDGSLGKWSIPSMQPIESYQINMEGLRCMQVIDDAHCLIGASDHHLHLFDYQQMHPIQKIEKAHSNSVFAIAKEHDRLITGGRDAVLTEWSLPSFKKLSSIEAHWFTINDLIMLPQDKLLVSASRDKSIRIWDSDSLQLLATSGLQQGGHVNSVNALAYSPSHHYLYSAGDDRSIIVYKIGEL